MNTYLDQRITEFNISESEIKSRYEYALRGFTAELTPSKLALVENHEDVLKVEQDIRFNAISGVTFNSSSYNSKKYSHSQSTPWGISRVGGTQNGVGKKAWVIDTGIDLNHPDLTVDVGNSVSFVGGESADDLNGHGTHVAGTIAALDNSRDVVGVAAGATVVSVKVLDQTGFGNTSDVLDGINYVAGRASANDIVNMSLTLYNPSNSITVIDDAVKNSSDSGIRFSIAAGNSDDNTSNFSPARVENTNVWTVSAYDDQDVFASFSNYGNPPIEYGGPGVSILSLDINGATATKNGTSMAAPHLAGLLLTVPNDIGTDGYVTNDPDGTADGIAAYTPFEVSISGPLGLDSNEQGTWTATPANGSCGYTYQWYFKNIGQSTWGVGGTSSSYSRSFENLTSNSDNVYLKVVVTSGSEQTESVFSTLIMPSGCPSGQICM